jgi:hypothetical protein
MTETIVRTVRAPGDDDRGPAEAPDKLAGIHFPEHRLFPVDPVMALKVAIAQGRARREGQAFLDRLAGRLEELASAGEPVPADALRNARRELLAAGRDMLLDFCVDGPFDLVAVPWSAVCPDVSDYDAEDEEHIDAIYGPGFAFTLLEQAVTAARHRRARAWASWAGWSN